MVQALSMEMHVISYVLNPIFSVLGRGPGKTHGCHLPDSMIVAQLFQYTDCATSHLRDNIVGKN